MADAGDAFNSSVQNLHAYNVSAQARAVIDQGQARMATAKEYADWVEIYIRNGGRITRICDYDTPDMFIIIKKDVDIPPLRNASALHVIVPEGVRVHLNKRDDPSGLGNNELHYMADGVVAHTRPYRDTIVCLYKDTLLELKKRPAFQKAASRLLMEMASGETQNFFGEKGFQSPSQKLTEDQEDFLTAAFRLSMEKESEGDLLLTEHRRILKDLSGKGRITFKKDIQPQ